MKLYASRVIRDGDDVYWLIYWTGEYARPVAALTDLEMKRFIKSVQEEQERAK